MPMNLERAVSVMSGFGRHWGMAGGWAIDLFLTRQTRPHADVDVAVLRDDQHELRSCLGDAHVQKVVAHELTDWPADEVLEQPIHEVHATWPDGYHLEFLLNEQDRQTHEWVFRRDARIRPPLVAAFRSQRGVPFLAPEIVLPYKSNHRWLGRLDGPVDGLPRGSIGE